MKKHGYRAEFAAAVESASSTGGQIMPPVMGAAAFVMTEFIGVPYSRLILYAAIPACLYYLAILMMVHFEALKLGLEGLPRDQLPPLRRVLARRGYVVLPLVGLIVALLLDYTAIRAAFVALAMTVGLMLAEQVVRGAGAVVRGEATPLGALGRVCRRLGGDVSASFMVGAKSAVDIGCATAGAGVIVAATTMTGLGLNLTALATKGGLPLILVLVLVAATCILLGMAVPTTPAYIMTAALAAPAVVGLGIGELAAHMFIFYFAVMSMVTPPVALAAYAAAQIAQANIMRTGYLATFLASAGFIVPFMFVYGPELLLQGSPARVLWACLTATVGVTALAAALIGWCLTRAGVVDRVCFGVGALLLIHPWLVTDALGGLLVAAGLALQWHRRREEQARGGIAARAASVHAVHAGGPAPVAEGSTSLAHPESRSGA
jgi:TRAP transporter 4TM/12TM fusion protein